MSVFSKDVKKFLSYSESLLRLLEQGEKKGYYFRNLSQENKEKYKAIKEFMGEFYKKDKTQQFIMSRDENFAKLEKNYKVIQVYRKNDQGRVLQTYMTEVLEWVERTSATKFPSATSENEDEKKMGEYLLIMESKKAEYDKTKFDQDKRKKYLIKYPEMAKAIGIYNKLFIQVENNKHKKEKEENERDSDF